MWLFFGGIVLLAYTGINIFTGVRFLSLVKYFLPSLKSFVFWPLYILFCYSFLFIMFLRLDGIRFLRQAAMYVLPFVVYFCLTLLVLDGVWLVLRFLNRVFLLSFICVRRELPAVSAAWNGIALGLAILAMIYGSFHARDIRTVYYNVTLNKVDSGRSSQTAGLRITVISDLHLGVTVGRKWTANVVDAVNRTKPDLICIAGDIFDNDVDIVRDIDGVAAELRRLRAPLGVYACPGNHDVDRLSLNALREGSSLDRIHDFLKKANVVFLLDEVELVADRFYLIGRKDARPIGLNQVRKSAASLAADLDKSRPLIFLDHQPVDYRLEEEAGADLILSGHTHRGQFFPGNIFTHFIYKKAGAVDYGLWQGRSAQGIVSSGAGLWGPPIRIATNSEVAVVEIKFK